MNNARNPAQNAEADIDQEIGAASGFEEDGDEREEDCKEVEKGVGI